MLYAILFMLQPHKTHDMPPLDITVFLSLKTHGKTFVKIIYSTIPPESLPKINLVAHSHKHGEKALVPISIISGFKCTGVYSINPQALLDKCRFSDNLCTLSVAVTDKGKSSDGGYTGEKEDEDYNFSGPKHLSWLKISHPEATLQPGFSLLPPSEQQDDYLEALNCNNVGVSLPSE